jgi:hypothetical protein
MMTQDSAPRLLNAFRAGQVATPVRDAVGVQWNQDPRQAFQTLTVGRFDQAPVIRQNHVVGWVKTANLETALNLKAVLRPLAESAIVSADAPLADLLDLLGSHEFVFTVDEGISGFVTPSDLDRHASRSHFYLLISAIEMLLSEVARQTLEEEYVESRIRDGAREAWDTARDHNAEADPIEYLYLQDLAELFVEAHENVAPWTKELTNRLTDICMFRPVVMHPTRSLTAGRTASQLASLARGADGVIRALTAIACR